MDVSIGGVTDPAGGGLTITILDITQNEPTDREEARNPCPDGFGVGTSIAHLRAERTGTGDGRVYHITFVADDVRGGRCTGSVTVCVPIKRAASCVFEGSLFDSTVGICSSSRCNELCGIEQATASVCMGQSLPDGLRRRIEKSRFILARAADATGEPQLERLVKSAIRNLERAGRIAGRAGKRGVISSGCAESIEAMTAAAEQRLGRLRETP